MCRKHSEIFRFGSRGAVFFLVIGGKCWMKDELEKPCQGLEP